MALKHSAYILIFGFLFCIFIFHHFGFTYAADINATITTGVFVPTVPLNLAVTVGEESLTLVWSPPYSDGGSSITDYVIEYKLTSGGVWGVFSDDVSTSTTVVVTSIMNDTSYDFRVSAVNAIGQGSSSSEVSATPGSPVQVLVTGVTDLTIPSIATSIRITNEGTLAYEYEYTWCITNSDVNLCGGGDDVFSSTASKLIQPSENWDTSLTSTVSATGNYWFHIQVNFGSDVSYASQSFTATQQQSSGSSGGSSGSRSKGRSCIGGDLNHDKIVNLIDFSILLIFFNTQAPFTNPCVDINKDGKANVVDVSIMLTQWGKKPVIFKESAS